MPQIEVPRMEAPRAVDAKELLAEAGLQMVETRAGAAQATVPEEEPAKLGRARRERPQAAAEEPLVQVETRK